MSGTNQSADAHHWSQHSRTGAGQCHCPNRPRAAMASSCDSRRRSVAAARPPRQSPHKIRLSRHGHVREQRPQTSRSTRTAGRAISSTECTGRARLSCAVSRFGRSPANDDQGGNVLAVTVSSRPGVHPHALPNPGACSRCIYPRCRTTSYDAHREAGRLAMSFKTFMPTATSGS
jgi:hypothetical protein